MVITASSWAVEHAATELVDREPMPLAPTAKQSTLVAAASTPQLSAGPP
jgi:hypothetical protein